MTLFLLVPALAIAGPLDDAGRDDAFETDPFELDLQDIVVDDAPRPDAIVGGTTTSGYPEVVSLLVGGSSCSATLITPEFVLTAAHCITEVPNTSDGVVVWGPNVQNPELTVPWGEYWVHPDWNRGNLEAGNDIAVIQLASPVTDMPVSILNDAPITDDWVGAVLTFVGYGITSTGGWDSGTKRETDNGLVRFTSNLIYAFDENSGTCQGDSGGPSFVATDDGYLEQVGITSFGGPRCEEGEHGHTRVDVFIPWIREIAPDILTEPPKDGPGSGPGGGDGIGFLDWGVSGEINGLGGNFRELTGGDGGGCSTAPGMPAAFGWIALALLGLRRR